MAACIDVPEALHHGIEALSISGALGELRKPLAERLVEGSALGAGDGARAFNEVFVGAEGDVFHTIIVYTSYVRLTGR